jgi:hypothetical protein
MQLNWSGSSAPGWSGRVLEPEWLESAGPAHADRNLRELAVINRWFGGHRALLRMMKGLVDPRNTSPSWTWAPVPEIWESVSQATFGMQRWSRSTIGWYTYEMRLHPGW